MQFYYDWIYFKEIQTEKKVKLNDFDFIYFECNNYIPALYKENHYVNT